MEKKIEAIEAICPPLVWDLSTSIISGAIGLSLIELELILNNTRSRVFTCSSFEEATNVVFTDIERASLCAGLALVDPASLQFYMFNTLDTKDISFGTLIKKMYESDKSTLEILLFLGDLITKR